MKIWIDLTNSPHINFFIPFIKKWKNESHEVIITTRNLANTIELAKQNHLDFKEIGGHAGKNKFFKFFYFPFRVFALYFYLFKNKLDIGISHSSFYSPIVCKFLNIPSIYLNDNEYAKGNKIAFRFATLNLLPESLSSKAIKSNWISKYNIEFYPGIKEAIYLSQTELFYDNPKVNMTRNKIFIRLEPWTAEYYKGKNEFMDPFIQKLANKYEVVILPRSNTQRNHFHQIKFNEVQVSEKMISLQEIKKSCIVFIGAGGSMTRELAFLGVPTLSVYQDNLLSVDNELIKLGLIKHESIPTLDDVEYLIDNYCSNINLNLFKNGKTAFDLINKKVISLSS